MSMVRVKKNKTICVVIKDPFNKVYVEKALNGFPYRKTYDYVNNATWYSLKNSRRDGQAFCAALGDILVSNNMKFGYENPEKNNGNLILHDEVPENA